MALIVLIVIGIVAGFKAMPAKVMNDYGWIIMTVVTVIGVVVMIRLAIYLIDSFVEYYVNRED